jgi:Arm DNA-binding domain
MLVFCGLALFVSLPISRYMPKAQAQCGAECGADVSELTELTVKRAKEGRHVDGDGLMLVVRPTGKKSWVLRYQMNGIRRDMGLGSYPEIGLKEARQRTADARRMIEAGKDPIDGRQAAQTAAKPIPTFGEIAALVVADAQAKTTNAR